MSDLLLEEVPGRVLAIYAHPDDPDISCGGTLARWSAAGSSVQVLICTSGDKGTTDPEADPEALVAARVVEAHRSAEVLGVENLHLLGHPDGELENDASLRRELVQIIRHVRPDAIISPDPLAVFFGEHHYNHRDHRIVGWAALDAAAPAAASPLYFKGAGPAHQVTAAYLSGSLEPNIWVDVTSTIDLKIEAVSCHRSQLDEASDWIAGALREGAEHAGREAGVRYAEPFRRIRLVP
jgi:LmbE family N-acetylglucosaminyl deacetylase